MGTWAGCMGRHPHARRAYSYQFLHLREVGGQCRYVQYLQYLQYVQYVRVYVCAWYLVLGTKYLIPAPSTQ